MRMNQARAYLTFPPSLILQSIARQGTMRSLFLLATLCAGLFLSPTASAANAATDSKDDIAKLVFEPASEHKQSAKTAGQVLKQVSRMHVSGDEISAEDVCMSVLEVVDYDKSYLSQGDIDDVQESCNSILESVRAGDLKPALRVYNRATARRFQAIGYKVDLLDNHDFDFEKDESLRVDRKEYARESDDQALKDLWRRQVKNEIIYRVLNDDEAKFDAARESLKKRYVNVLRRAHEHDDEDAANVLINAVIRVHDPHTGYMSPEQYKDYLVDQTKSLEGIGVHLQQDGDYLKVLRTFPNGPAARTGKIFAGDYIVGVAQADEEEITDIVGMFISDAVKMIRGDKGTNVRLTIVPGSKHPSAPGNVVEIKRERVTIDNQRVQHGLLEVPIDDEQTLRVGIIQINQFYGTGRADAPVSATQDTRAALEALTEQGMDALVLDLRNNGGGLLGEAIRLLDLFLPPGPRLQVQDRYNVVLARGSRRSRPAYRGPLAVYVNRLSASASEIVAGAIQDYGRGIIIGENTFGKGSVQGFFELGGGQLKVTSRRFYRVNGDGVQFDGVSPDVWLPSGIDFEEIGETSRPFALESDSVDPVRFFAIDTLLAPPSYLQEELEERSVSEPRTEYLVALRRHQDEFSNEEKVSLVLDERRLRTENYEARLLEIENTYRAASGKPEFADIEALEDYRQERFEQSYDTYVPDEDANILEVARVIADGVAGRQSMEDIR